jgi:hypothetical protein
MDGNFRFSLGLWFGVGLVGVWMIPTIERQTTVFRGMWFAVFCGGVGRLISFFSVGAPPPVFAALGVVELLGAPVFIYWQHRVAISATSLAQAAEVAAATVT